MLQRRTHHPFCHPFIHTSSSETGRRQSNLILNPLENISYPHSTGDIRTPYIPDNYRDLRATRNWWKRGKAIADYCRNREDYRLPTSYTMYRSILLFATAILPAIVGAQQLQDGVIVPFSSDLPSCASQCGPLSDVQGACSPPARADVSSSCFCSDSRLTPFLAGTTGVSQVCGAASCTSDTDLQSIETWYQQYCNTQSASTTTSSSGSAATSSSSSGSSSGSANQSWYVIFKWKKMIQIANPLPGSLAMRNGLQCLLYWLLE